MEKTRRPRMRRVASGKPLALTGRDLEVMRCIVRYRYLRSTYLHAFAGGASEKRFVERLCELFHHGLIGRAAQQWMYASALCQPIVYEAEPRARSILSEAGDTAARTYLSSGMHRQFKHALAICECLASMELATQARDNLRFIPWPEIVSRAPEVARSTDRPIRLSVGGAAVIPDGFFGIEYHSGEKKSYRFFALELDRGTMPIERSYANSSSYMGKMASYGEVIASRGHKALLGIPNLLVLTVTTDNSRKEHMMRALPRTAASAVFLFKALPELVAGGSVMPPRYLPFEEPWQRQDRPPIDIFSAA